MPGRVLLHIDGASRGNPGPAAIGVVVSDSKGQVLKNISQSIGETTNNVAEYTALIYGLQEALMMRASEVVIHTDSELLAKQFNRLYKVKHDNIKPLFEQAMHLKRGFAKVEVRHVGREQNRGADKLANKALGPHRRREGSPGDLTQSVQAKQLDLFNYGEVTD